MADVVDEILRPHRPSIAAIHKSKKIKVFVKSLLSGMPVAEAKQVAGIPLTSNSRDLLATPIGKMELMKFLQDDYNPSEIRKKMKQLWDAEEPVFSNGGFVGHRPNFEVQDKQLNRILKMLDYSDNPSGDVSTAPPTQIVFNTLVESSS